MSAKLIVVYWRDIPAQVIVKRGRKTEKIPLPDRFMAAIDRAAMRAGRGSSDHYLEDWRRVSEPCDGDPAEAAAAAAKALIARFPDDWLERVTKNGGSLPADPDAAEG